MVQFFYKSFFMALETQNINNPLNAHQHNVDVNSLKESLKAY
jgi:hypothetical protein